MASFELDGLLSMDASDFVGGLSDSEDAASDFAGEMDDVNDAVEDTSDSLGNFEDVDFGGIATGLGVSGAAGGAQALADSSRDMRESIALTAETLDEEDEVVTDLVTSLSDSTLSTEEAAEGMDIFARFAADSAEEAAEFTETADLIADATGDSVSGVATLAETVQGIDGSMENFDDGGADAFVSALRNTTLDAGQMGQVLERSREDIQEMGLGAEESALLLSSFQEETGLSGRRLRSEFSTAVEDADGDLEQFAEDTGVAVESTDDLDAMLDESAGMAQSHADAMADTHTEADTMRAIADDLRLEFGNLIQPVSALLPAITAGGAALAGLSSVGVTAGGALGTVGSAAALLTGPIGIAVAAAGLLAFLFRDELMEAFDIFIEKGEELREWFDDAFGDDIQDVTEEAGDTLDSVIDDIGSVLDWGGGKVEDLADTFDDELAIIERLAEGAFDALKIIFETGIDNALEIVSVGLSVLRGDWDGALEGLENIGENTWEAIEDLFENGLDTINDITGGGVDDVRETFTGLREFFVDVWDLHPLSDTFEAAAGTITGDGDEDGIVPTLDADVRGALDSLRDWAETGWDMHPMSAAFDGAREEIADEDGGIMANLTAGVRGSLSGLNSWVEDTFGVNLKDAFGTAFGFAADAVEEQLGGLIDAVEAVLSPVTEAIESTIESIKDLTDVNVDVSVPSADEILPSSVPGIGGSGSGGGGVGAGTSETAPVAHTGGMITRTGRAFLEAGERVLPASQVNDRGEAELADATGGGTTINIERLVADNPSSAARELKKELKAQL